jgi:hypothetical protein
MARDTVTSIDPAKPLCDGTEEAVIWPHEEVTARRDDDGGALGPDPGIDDHDVDCA